VYRIIAYIMRKYVSRLIAPNAKFLIMELEQKGEVLHEENEERGSRVSSDVPK